MSPLLLDRLFLTIWSLWLLYWFISAFGVKPAAREESRSSRLGRHTIPILIAVLLLMYRFNGLNGTFFNQRFVPDQPWIAQVGFALAVLGLLFTCWARVTLGRNWSAIVQLKQDHELIVRGPYRLVRHPIYTGLLLAVLGTALATGEWRALISLALITLAFWLKLRLEERWLCEQFGEQYRRYMHRVKALVPGVV